MRIPVSNPNTKSRYSMELSRFPPQKIFRIILKRQCRKYILILCKLKEKLFFNINVKLAVGLAGWLYW